MTGDTWLLAGIELAIFDKDGTLIDFHLMWSDWVGNLAAALSAAHGGPLDDLVYATMGVDRASGQVLPHGALAATPMARIRGSLEEALGREAGIAASEARRLLDVTWHGPDPVILARPLADLPALFGALRRRGTRIAVATSDDREPTLRTLEHLDVDGFVEAVACADDGRPVKPNAAAVLWICRSLGVEPAQAAVIGDAPADMAMGRAAGVGLLVGVRTGVGDGATLGATADVLIDSVADLLPPG